MAFPSALSVLGLSSSISAGHGHPHYSLLPNSQTNPATCSFSSPSPHTNTTSPSTSHSSKPYTTPSSYSSSNSFRISYRFSAVEGEGDEEEDCSFDEAVVLFNTREYYKCHDFLEALWNNAEEPTRTLIHGILQCAVGFHHLFNQNHRGAMMELGEGLCKLRKMNFRSGPFSEFEQEISAALDFIYQTQIELAACGDDVCVAMDQSERSYQLLGGYGAGQLLYTLQGEGDPNDQNNQTMYILFCPQRSYASHEPPKVKLPTLNATSEHLMACEYI